MLRVTGTHRGAISKYGDAIGDFKNFFHLVRNIDDRNAVLFRRALQLARMRENNISTASSESELVGSSITIKRALKLQRSGDGDEYRIPPTQVTHPGTGIDG